MRSEQRRKRSGYWLAGLAMVLAAGMAQAEAGRVVFVTGEAKIERGTDIPLTKDALVESGDVITTGEDGRVQVRMVNGELIALRPNTRFVIDEFVAPVVPGQPASGRSFYSLLRGGFRTITGAITGRDLNSYRIHTPVATLGIRGCDFAALLDEGTGELLVGAKTELAPPPGSEGTLVASNSAGILDIPPENVAKITDTFSQPTLLDTPQPTLERLFGEYADLGVTELPPASEPGTAAGTETAAATGSGSAGGLNLGTGLLILGGVGILAEALSSDGSGGTSTTTTTTP